MDVVVNDTNIFIDLFSVDLLPDIFALPIHVHTVDFVIAEIKDQPQRKALQAFIDNKKLFVKKHSSEEVQNIVDFKISCKGNVSIADCAVWQYAEQNNYVLLTGDRQLRSSAIAAGVSVLGILFVIDEMVKHQIISKCIAAEKLEQLFQINKRLPKHEIEERISCWRK